MLNQEATIEVYSIKDQEISYQTFTQTLLDQDYNIIVLAARIICEQVLNLDEQNDRIWQVGRYIQVHSFMTNDVSIAVPLPNYHFQNLKRSNGKFEEHYQKALQYNLIEQPDLVVPKDLYETTILIIQLQDYSPFQKLGAALYCGPVMRVDEQITYIVFPQDERINQFDNLKAVIISGAKYDYNQDSQWMRDLYQLVLDLYHNYPQVKFYGICLGHQVIASIFGGKVSSNPCGTYIYKKEQITLSEAGIHTFPELPQVFHCAEAHYHRVEILPENALLLASSQSCSIEMFKIENRIICTQFHPDFPPIFLTQFFNQRILSKQKITQEQYEICQRDYSISGKGWEDLMRNILNFLLN